MSPQLLWTIAGLILTILTLGGITISSSQSLDSAQSKMIASEIGNVAVASKLWIANNSTNGTFSAITPTLLSPLIPDLVLNTLKYESKVIPVMRIDVGPATPNTNVLITLSGGTAVQTALVSTALAGKACAQFYVAGATILTYTCNG